MKKIFTQVILLAIFSFATANLTAQTYIINDGGTYTIQDGWSTKKTKQFEIASPRPADQLTFNFSKSNTGVGGVTVEGMVSGQQYRVGKRGYGTYSFSVMGLGINAQIEVYLTPGTNQASATIYPNFNSNTVWVQGSIVPYDNANVIEGSSF